MDIEVIPCTLIPGYVEVNLPDQSGGYIVPEEIVPELILIIENWDSLVNPL